MRIHNVMHGSRANGPGLRSVVWTQGCSLACPGCQNPLSHHYDGGRFRDPIRLGQEIIRDAPEGTDGITVSGGEPMQQPLGLYGLICTIKSRRPSWSIGIYSGYYEQELSSGAYQPLDGLTGHPSALAFVWKRIKARLDFGIFGRYDRTKPITGSDRLRSDAGLVSSANQSVVLFGSRYEYSDFPPLTAEFSISEEGLVQVTGFPPASVQEGGRDGD